MKICENAGRYNPSMTPPKYVSGSSLISNLCVNRIVTSMLERMHNRMPSNSYGQLNDSSGQTSPKISLSSAFGISRLTSIMTKPQNLEQRPAPSYDPGTEKAHDNFELAPANDFDSDELFLRDFFPEVWLL